LRYYINTRVDETKRITRNLAVGTPVGTRNRFLPNTTKTLPKAMGLGGKKVTVHIHEIIDSIYMVLPIRTVTISTTQADVQFHRHD